MTTGSVDMSTSLWGVEANTIKKSCKMVELNIKALYTINLPQSGYIGPIPTEFRPSKELCIPAAFPDAGSGILSGFITVSTNGDVKYRCNGTTARWVIVHAVYNL